MTTRIIRKLLAVAVVTVASLSNAAALVVVAPDASIEAQMEALTPMVLNAGNLLGPEAFLDNGDGTFTSAGTREVRNAQMGMWDFEWEMTVKPDPHIIIFSSVRNLAPIDRTFSLSFLLPLAVPITPASFHGGSIDATVTDTNGDASATLAEVGSGIYDGQIDGVSTLSLLSIPTVPLGCGGTGCSANAVDFFGLPAAGTLGASLPGGSALTSIGVNLDFVLSAGDTVTFSGLFEVVPVPVPAAIWLLGGSLVGLVVTRRRSI